MQKPQKKNALGNRPVFQWAIIVVAILFLVIIAFVPTTRSYPPVHAHALRSQANVRSVAQGLVKYATDHDDDVFVSQELFPDTLLNAGCLREEMLVSPIAEEDTISYIYVPGPCEFDAKQILIYEDPSHWKDFVIVGFADAHVEHVDHEIFEKMLADQLAADSSP